MLANFAREGSESHMAIRAAIDSFLSAQQEGQRPYRNEHCTFFDFEHYPKFEFDEEQEYSPFIKKLMNHLTGMATKTCFTQFINVMNQ